MNFAEEFQTVDLVVASDAETRGVDAFALSLIKAERQIRKLFTYLMFQFPAFSVGEFKGFRGALGKSRDVYFEGFVAGLDALYPRTVKEIVGAEYDVRLAQIKSATEYRNKIFHGQVTDQYLSREELLNHAAVIRKWCEDLAQKAQKETGYDGFGRNSLHKNLDPIWKTYRVQISSLQEYEAFIRQHMERRSMRARTSATP